MEYVMSGGLTETGLMSLTDIRRQVWRRVDGFDVGDFHVDLLNNDKICLFAATKPTEMLRWLQWWLDLRCIAELSDVAWSINHNCEALIDFVVISLHTAMVSYVFLLVSALNVRGLVLINDMTCLLWTPIYHVLWLLWNSPSCSLSCWQIISSKSVKMIPMKPGSFA